MRPVKQPRRRRLALLAAFALLLAAAALLAYGGALDGFARAYGGGGDVSCHYTRLPDELPGAEDAALSPQPGRSIFFHETSCRADGAVGLTARQACAVESAALANPERRVLVLFLSPLVRAAAAESARRTPLDAALSYGNVRAARILLERYAAGTPLEVWLATGALNASHYRTSHTSDVLRYLTLWKYGGVYLDLDVVVARPLDELVANWAGRESRTAVAAGAISFSGDADGRRFADAAIRELRSSFDGTDWGNNGPGVITRVLQRHCHTKRVHLMSAQRCGGFEVYPEEYFYPVSWPAWRRYFEPDALPAVRNMTRAYIFHVWNKHSAKLRLRKRALARAPYLYLAAKYCPRVYATVEDYF